MRKYVLPINEYNLVRSPDSDLFNYCFEILKDSFIDQDEETQNLLRDELLENDLFDVLYRFCSQDDLDELGKLFVREYIRKGNTQLYEYLKERLLKELGLSVAQYFE